MRAQFRGSASPAITRVIAACWWASWPRSCGTSGRIAMSPPCSSTGHSAARSYERLRALGFNNVFEVNFGLTHTPDRAKANMRAYMWDRMKDWLLRDRRKYGDGSGGPGLPHQPEQPVG